MHPHASSLPRALPCAALHVHCHSRCTCNPIATCACREPKTRAHQGLAGRGGPCQARLDCVMVAQVGACMAHDDRERAQQRTLRRLRAQGRIGLGKGRVG